ncbi:GNAT family N-acetyltransferase [Dapis sp. BLCC M229]|uniref:GNAT family N-acetyltransferase n=1 Tax=Dapis sp. BLCC M229 TaxID=3400188 RepID=UPI003CE9EB7F
MAPIAGVPREVWEKQVLGQDSKTNGNISALPASLTRKSLDSLKFQQVYHLTAENLKDYNEFTFPPLQKRWQIQPQRGELFGTSASVEGEMVAFAIAEVRPERNSELISLFVAPAYRQQGIGKRLVAYLERGVHREGCTQISVKFEPNPLTEIAFQPLLKTLGWQEPIAIGNQQQCQKIFSVVTSTPQVSVVMTVYNMEAYLAEALDSLLAQTFTNWELILWDDGSTDSSVAIAQKYTQRDPRIRFQKGERLGRSKALKQAHSLTKGDYVGWLDADDRLAPNALAETVTFLEDNPEYGMVYTNHIDMDAQGNPQGLGYRCQIPYRPHRLLIDMLTFHFRLLRQSVFEVAGGINLEMECAPDYDLCLRVEEVSQIYHLERPLYFYRLNPHSISHQQNALQRQASEWAVNQALERRGLAQTYRLIGDEKTGKFRLQQRDTASIGETAKAQFETGKNMARQGNLEGAVASFTEAIRLQPDYLAAHNQLGKAYQQLGQTQEAISTYKNLLSINPNLAQAHCNLGAIWQIQGHTEDALAAYQKAIDLKPDFALAYLNLGRLKSQQEVWQSAEKSLQEAIRLQPNAAEAHYELGNVLRHRGKFKEAIASYEIALKYQPQLLPGWNNLGGLWMQRGDMQKAQACFEKVLKLNADFIPVYRNLGDVLETQGKFTEALACYNHILEQTPDNTEVFYRKEHLRLILCDWDEYDKRMETLHQRLQAHLKEETAPPLLPLPVNCFRIPIANHIAVAKHWGKYVSRSVEKINPHFPPPAPPSPKLRLGYISADFRQHAMGTLIHQLFPYHDSSKFEVYGYSLHHHQDKFTATIKEGIHQFRDLSDLTPEAAARQIHGDGIHILIDLSGYTTFSRPEILALQPAPIQIQYLGYPNTMGADFMQYILADQWLIPPELEDYYSEKVIRLPHALVGSPLEMSNKPFTREDFGLPTNGFVFYCFNRTHKFDPQVFGTWMRILAQVPDSVLWLIETTPDISQNLRNLAQTQGISPSRLVFTPRLPLDEYLKAYTLADLFLDTWVYNAGATAIHALGAGLPFMTCPGSTFAARMGASICAAADLDLFICSDVTDYEQKAVHFATHADELATIRQRLCEQRHTLPLFQPQQWIADLEATCWQLWGKVHPG